MNVVLVGGGGRIGAYVLRELQANTDHSLTVFDRVPPAAEGVRWIRGETGDFGEVVSGLYGADALIHLAGITVPYKEAPDHVLFRNNVVGTYNVHEAAYRLGIRRVVSTSSSAISGWTYGQREVVPDYLPVDEEHPVSPHDPYGLGKLCEEQVARSFTMKCDMETIALRPAWVVFPEQREQLRRQGGLLPQTFNLCAYVDVRDLAVAFRKALGIPDIRHEVVFVVADDSSCREPLSEVLPRLMPALGDKASGLTGHMSGVSNTRAKRLLGWQPVHSWRVDEPEFGS